MSPAKRNIAKELAAKFGVSTRTVLRAGAFFEDVDTISHYSGPWLSDLVTQGKRKLSQAEVHFIARELSPSAICEISKYDQSEIKKIIRRIKTSKKADGSVSDLSQQIRKLIQKYVEDHPNFDESQVRMAIDESLQ